MAYKVAANKNETREQLGGLIDSFKKQYAFFKTAKYSEAQLRIDFLNPLLKSFGWDVDNESAKSQFLRDVVQEESIEVEEADVITKKNPDYTLRILGNRKLFVEAKKVAIDIETSKAAAFQTRRYGWNANLGISVLTNFEKLVVYDCRYKPNNDDEPQTARYKVFHFEQYVSQLDELSQILSYESISSGFIDEYFSLSEKDITPFDEYFLHQIEEWREQLAVNVLKNNIALHEEEINFLIQRLLNRIIFLRFCEDRNIEKYETLKEIKDYNELKALFLESDEKYNSGLFDFIEDSLSLGIQIEADALICIFHALYYPLSPYDFSVIEANILSQIYEKYLGSRIRLTPEKSIQIFEEPEVIASNGVVPTPKRIVDQIVRETLEPIFERSSGELESLKVADICCGSGTFLLSLFDILIEKYTELWVNEGHTDPEKIYQSPEGDWLLTLRSKQHILLNNVFGLDINPYAVEVSQFSLLLKLLEHENANSVDYHFTTYKQKVLPNLANNIKCGNALLDDEYFSFNKEALADDELLYALKPFNWYEEFPFLQNSGGFDAIIGNPPYVRIQTLVKYFTQEITYYQSKQSPYSVGANDNIDKYYLFIERAIQLTHQYGVIGYIVPHKFFIVKGGQRLREAITSQANLAKIIHFGVTQVFPGRSTYTAILILDKQKRETFLVTRIPTLNEEHIFRSAPSLQYSISDYAAQPWIFLSENARTLFEKIRNRDILPLKDIAEIPVGLQTSADKIYIITPIEQKEESIVFEKNGKTWEIEKSILLPCIYDLSFSLFDILSANASIIFPYSISEGKAVVFSEEDMQHHYPLCWKYLNFHKHELGQRSITGSKDVTWYQFGRSQSLTKFHNTPKLIWPVLSTQPCYAYDQANLQFTGGGNGPYYSLIPKTEYSLFYLMGILSHPVFEAMIKAGASEFRGAYYSHGKQFIENLPIRRIDFSSTTPEKGYYDAIIKTTQEIIATKQSYAKTTLTAKKTVLQRKIDYLLKELISTVNALYAIDARDVDSIKDNKLFLTEHGED